MRGLFIVALLLAAGHVAAQPTDACLAYTDEATCWAQSCNWCKTATVKPSCRSWAGASILPPSVFSCGNETRTDCAGFKSQTDCYAHTGCSWCICAAVPSSCKNVATAKKAPPSVFNCTWA